MQRDVDRQRIIRRPIRGAIRNSVGRRGQLRGRFLRGFIGRCVGNRARDRVRCVFRHRVRRVVRRCIRRLHHVGGENPLGVTLDVEHLEPVRCVAAGAQGLAQHVRKRRRLGHAHLDKTLHPKLPQDELLRFNPAHRRGELPGQQLDEQGAGEGGIGKRRAVCPLPAQLRDDGRIDDPFHGGEEVVVQREWPRHKVRDVAPHQPRGGHVGGNELF